MIVSYPLSAPVPTTTTFPLSWVSVYARGKGQTGPNVDQQQQDSFPGRQLIVIEVANENEDVCH